MTQESHGGVARSTMHGHSPSGPPATELPVALATPEMTWRGDGIVLVVPSLLIYMTGAELTVMCRTRATQPQSTEHVRDVADTLPRSLKANGYPIQLLGGQYTDDGFTHRAWAAFRPGDAGQDLSVTLAWHGWPADEYQIAGQAVSAAARSVATFW
jgi:hypothetical protein